MAVWLGGINKTSKGYMAYVPVIKGVGLQKTFVGKYAYQKAISWQAREGRSIWGDAWTIVKKKGKTSVLIIDKKGDGWYILSGSTDKVGAIITNYTRIGDDDTVCYCKKQFSYGKQGTERITKNEAILSAIRFREKNDQRGRVFNQQLLKA